MYTVTARGPRQIIEDVWDSLAWADPSPASAVDAKEDTRQTWRLDAYAETEDSAGEILAIIQEMAPHLNPVISQLADRDWVTHALQGLPPVRAGGLIVTGQHGLTGAGGKTEIVIEAGPAFGTGHHGTTLGCLLALQTILQHHRPRTILDVGTGSGVLAIAALKRQAKRAIATDIDAQSVTVSCENAAKNSVASRYRAYRTGGGLSAAIYRQAPFDLVFANILSRPLIRLAPRLVPVIAPGGHIILSGLLRHQEPLVRAAYSHRGLTLRTRFHRDGWSSLVFARPA